MPSFKDFTGHLDELETKTYAQLFDISNFFLPDKEVIKKLIKQKNPYFTEQEIDDIVDSAEEAEAKLEEAEKKLEEEEERLEKEREEAENTLNEGRAEANEARADANEVRSEANESVDDNRAEERERKKEERKAKRAEKRAEFKKLREEQQAEMKRIYKDAVEQMKKEVQDLKKEIQEAAHKLFNEFINLTQKLITGLIKTVSSIVAVIGIISLPPWNIPLALLTLLTVLEFFLDLLRQLNQVAPILKPLKKLEAFMSKENLAKVAGILDPPIVFILGLYTPFEKFKKFIEKILAKLKSLTGNKSNQIKAFKKVTKKLKKLGYFKSGSTNFGTLGGLNGTDVEPDDDDEEVKAILDTYKIGPTAGTEFYGRTPASGGGAIGVIGYKEDDEVGGDEEVSGSGTGSSEESGGGSGSGSGSGSGNGSGSGAGVDAELKDTKVGVGGRSKQLPLNILNDPDSVKGALNSLNEFLNSKNIINDIKSEGVASVDNYVYDVLLPSGKILNSLSEDQLEELKKQFDLAFTNFEEDDNED